MYLSIFLTYLCSAFLVNYFSLYFVARNRGEMWKDSRNFLRYFFAFLLIFEVLILDSSTYLFLNQDRMNNYFQLFMGFCAVLSYIISQLYFNYTGWIRSVDPTTDRSWFLPILKTTVISICPIPFLMIGMVFSYFRYL